MLNQATTPGQKSPAPIPVAIQHTARAEYPALVLYARHLAAIRREYRRCGMRELADAYADRARAAARRAGRLIASIIRAETRIVFAAIARGDCEVTHVAHEVQVGGDGFTRRLTPATAREIGAALVHHAACAERVAMTDADVIRETLMRR